jgi:hypothetical protein
MLVNRVLSYTNNIPTSRSCAAIFLIVLPFYLFLLEDLLLHNSVTGEIEIADQKKSIILV